VTNKLVALALMLGVILDSVARSDLALKTWLNGSCGATFGRPGISWALSRWLPSSQITTIRNYDTSFLDRRRGNSRDTGSCDTVALSDTAVPKAVSGSGRTVNH